MNERLGRRDFKIPLSREYIRRMKLATGNEQAYKVPAVLNVEEITGTYDLAQIERQTLTVSGRGVIVPANGTATQDSFPVDADEKNIFRVARRVRYRGLSAFIDTVNPTTNLYIQVLFAWRGEGDSADQMMIVDNAAFNIATMPQASSAAFFGTNVDVPIPCGNSLTVTWGTGVVSDEKALTFNVPQFMQLRARRISETGSAQIFDVKFNLDIEF